MPSKLYVLLVSTFLITGCSTQMTMTGKAFKPVSPGDVKILFKDKPKCKYEELGFISTPLMYSQNRAVNSAREKAAEVGADYIVIESVHINEFNDASVSAMAYKCGDVEREKIKTSND